MAKTIPELSVDAKLIYERLRSLGYNDTITIEEIESITGRPLRNGGAGAFYTARKMAKREDHIILGSVRGVGYKRLDDEGIVGASESAIRHVGKASKRAFSDLACVEHFESLPAELQVAHNTHASLFNAIAGITRPGQVKRLEGRVQEAQQQLPLVRTLEAFR